MLRRTASLLVCSLAILLAATAQADPRFDFISSPQDPPNFRSDFAKCISQFRAAGGLAGSILNQLNGGTVRIRYGAGGSGTVNPNPGGDPTGKPNDISWNSRETGVYGSDPAPRAPKVPCAILLHELEHASRFFTGKECTGPEYANTGASRYDEKLGARAENWWLNRLGKQQRRTYQQGSDVIQLDRWTRWPPSPSSAVPKPPPCNRCPDPDASLASPSNQHVAAVCRRCVRFHQEGCFDFNGGIYSGGDHRRVANGSLRIVIGDRGYCQGRSPCAFKNCVTCPHLDTAFPEGVEVTAIATPGEDSRFARWGPGACQGKGQTCTFIARKDSCISAQFLLINPTAPPQSLPRVPCPEDP